MAHISEDFDDPYVTCCKCNEKKPDIEQQCSYGVYAGIMCRDCATQMFRDACGHRPEGQGSPSDLDEPYYEDY